MIRAAGSADCDRIYNLICEMAESKLNDVMFRSIFREQLSDSNYTCIVYEEDNIITGILNLRMENQLHHAARIAEIMELAVASGHRSKGIGKQLFQEACRIAQENGCYQLEVCCNQIRRDAHRFYEREGMQKTHFKLTMKLVL